MSTYRRHTRSGQVGVIRKALPIPTGLQLNVSNNILQILLIRLKNILLGSCQALRQLDQAEHGFQDLLPPDLYKQSQRMASRSFDVKLTNSITTLIQQILVPCATCRNTSWESGHTFREPYTFNMHMSARFFAALPFDTSKCFQDFFCKNQCFSLLTQVANPERRIEDIQSQRSPRYCQRKALSPSLCPLLTLPCSHSTISRVQLSLWYKLVPNHRHQGR